MSSQKGSLMEGLAIVFRKLAAAATQSKKPALNYCLATKLFDHIVFFSCKFSFSFFFGDTWFVGGNSCLGTGKSSAVNSPYAFFLSLF